MSCRVYAAAAAAAAAASYRHPVNSTGYGNADIQSGMTANSEGCGRYGSLYGFPVSTPSPSPFVSMPYSRTHGGLLPPDDTGLGNQLSYYSIDSSPTPGFGQIPSTYPSGGMLPSSFGVPDHMHGASTEFPISTKEELPVRPMSELEKIDADSSPRSNGLWHRVTSLDCSENQLMTSASRSSCFYSSMSASRQSSEATSPPDIGRLQSVVSSSPAAAAPSLMMTTQTKTSKHGESFHDIFTIE